MCTYVHTSWVCRRNTHFYTCYTHVQAYSPHNVLPQMYVISLCTHCTCQLFLSYIWWAQNAIAGSLHVVEQSSISIADTARNGVWIFIHTCSASSVVALIRYPLYSRDQVLGHDSWAGIMITDSRVEEWQTVHHSVCHYHVVIRIVLWGHSLRAATIRGAASTVFYTYNIHTSFWLHTMWVEVWHLVCVYWFCTSMLRNVRIDANVYYMYVASCPCMCTCNAHHQRVLRLYMPVKSHSTNMQLLANHAHVATHATCPILPLQPLHLL